MTRHRKTLPQKTFPQQQQLSQPVGYQHNARRTSKIKAVRLLRVSSKSTHTSHCEQSLMVGGYLCCCRSGRPVCFDWCLIFVTGLFLTAASVSLRVKFTRLIQYMRRLKMVTSEEASATPTFFGTDFLVSALTAACLAFTLFFAATAGLD